MAYTVLSRQWGRLCCQSSDLIDTFRLEYSNQNLAEFIKNSIDIKRNIKLGIIDTIPSLHEIDNIPTTIDNMDKILKRCTYKDKKKRLQRLTLNYYNKLVKQLYPEVRNY